MTARKKTPRRKTAKKKAKKRTAKKKTTKKKAKKRTAKKKTTKKKAKKRGVVKKTTKKKAKKRAGKKKTSKKKTTQKKASKKKGKKTARKTAKKPAVEKKKLRKAPAAPAATKRTSLAAGFPRHIGVITHFYPHAGAGIVAMEAGELRVGDTVHIRGHTTDYYQRVDRIELDHEAIEIARTGQVVGLHVSQRVREGDDVSVVST